MRILLLSAYGGRLWSYAPFESARLFVETITEKYSDVYFHWILPESDGKEWNFDKKQVIQNLEKRNVKLHFVPMLRSALNGTVVATRDLYELFNQLKTNLFYDCVMNYGPCFSPVLKKVLKPKWAMFAVDVPIFNIPTRVVNDDRVRMVKYNYYGEEEMLAEMVGYLTDYSIFLLEVERQMAIDFARKYLVPAVVRRLMENSVAITPFGVDCEKLDKIYEERKKIKRGVVTVFFGGRWKSQKGFADILKICQKVYNTGRKVRLICTTGEHIASTEIAGLHKEYPFGEFYESVNREMFFEKMREGDIFLCLSTVESFGQAYFEMLYAGLIGIFLESGFAREVLPDDYPFFVKNISEMEAMLVNVIDMMNLGSENIELNITVPLMKARDRIRKNYSLVNCNIKIYEWIKKNTQEFYDRTFKASGVIFELVKKSIKNGMNFDEVCAAMQMNSNKNRLFGRKGDRIGRFYLRRLILAAGYYDVCNDVLPVFLKEDL